VRVLTRSSNRLGLKPFRLVSNKTKPLHKLLSVKRATEQETNMLFPELESTIRAQGSDEHVG